MGWENRDGKSYYYQKMRYGPKVVSMYVGNDETACLLASLEQARREQDEQRRAQERSQILQLEKQAAADGEIFEAVEALTSATLLANGFHQHKGTWRKKRSEETISAKESADC